MTFPFPFVRRRSNIEATFIGGVSDPGDKTTYDFGNFVAPRPGLLVACVLGRRSTTGAQLSSVSMGGSAAVTSYAPVGTGNAVGIASKIVAAGAHNVSATFNASFLRAGVGVWLITGYTNPVPIFTSNDNGDGVTPKSTVSLSVSTPARSVSLFGFLYGNQPATWNNATKRYDALAEVAFSYADRTDRAATSLTVDASQASSSVWALVGATWI